MIVQRQKSSSTVVATNTVITSSHVRPVALSMIYEDVTWSFLQYISLSRVVKSMYGGTTIQVSAELNVNIGLIIFCDKTQCNLVDTDDSEEHAASIFRVKE
jgi:hypothetical protein